MDSSGKQPAEQQLINLGKDLYQVVQKVLFVVGCIFSALIIIVGLTMDREGIPSIEGIPHSIVRISMIFTMVFFLQFPWVIVALVRKYIRDREKAKKSAGSKQPGDSR
ncbi:MAG: hypothetical protein A2898_02120 [Candidatus Kerfeldbacteria bacterium RIFCSPLOWO2_01_FULL_48_11]|uniref:Uncharacterized protein n=1 Tax=Candidatus Kerfeldbacteria bacterium RIFCSPLOWO2_01_FULL_48_11 TaxID=1798543 RepID=A0A1G2B723_9BACT|nr:MAG: hypothetical protein UY34_C0019G0009 [Parcubacteria group bacterium GW2011_GWA2_48_9]KKW16083.1 MAG: hypothetical protein UY52_C0011G0071 [Parcubacteria group bacterium GW2011_GWC2_49_9]OGY84040.1 MAG: hypothetical protein A2898_02120 [Candidatus Kerfeldbacteria bacterium RIFCSPLOWO2_01_FULL_48_11]HCM68715.1 hypothetical protein [Candidatus Kerfeldbacteria bacterium]